MRIAKDLACSLDLHQHTPQTHEQNSKMTIIGNNGYSTIFRSNTTNHHQIDRSQNNEAVQPQICGQRA